MSAEKGEDSKMKNMKETQQENMLCSIVAMSTEMAAAGRCEN